MRILLKFCLYLLFIVSLVTGLGDLFGGASAIPGVHTTIPAAVDNELRCLAAFWLAYGIFCFWVVRDLNVRGHFIPAIAIALFVSGLARLLSLLMVGSPGIPFIPVMFIELFIALLLYLSYKCAFSGKLNS